MQLTKKCPKYTYRKDGVYYFSKAAPKDLLDLYCKPRIVKCLGLGRLSLLSSLLRRC